MSWSRDLMRMTSHGLRGLLMRVDGWWVFWWGLMVDGSFDGREGPLMVSWPSLSSMGESVLGHWCVNGSFIFDQATFGSQARKGSFGPCFKRKSLVLLLREGVPGPWSVGHGSFCSVKGVVVLWSRDPFCSAKGVPGPWSVGGGSFNLVCNLVFQPCPTRCSHG